MRIEAFAICYNEEMLLPYYLRHYGAFCDEITIYDNHSTDNSRRIIAQHPQTNCILYDSGNEIRDDIYLQIKNNCWKNSKADWVIIGDIDELVYHPNIRSELERTKATVIRPALFNMYSETFPSTTGQIWEEVVLGLPGGRKANLFRPDQVKEMDYDPGCHVSDPKGHIVIEDSRTIKTLHMKNLGRDYLISRKQLLNSRLSSLNKKLGWGIHYQEPDAKTAQYFEEEIKQARVIL